MEVFISALLGTTGVTQVVLFGFGMKCPFDMLGELDDLERPLARTPGTPLKIDVGLTKLSVDMPTFSTIDRGKTFRMFLTNDHSGSVQYPLDPNVSVTVTVYPTVLHLVKTHLDGHVMIPKTILGMRRKLIRIKKLYTDFGRYDPSCFTGYRQEVTFVV